MVTPYLSILRRSLYKKKRITFTEVSNLGKPLLISADFVLELYRWSRVTFYIVCSCRYFRKGNEEGFQFVVRNGTVCFFLHLGK